MLHLYILRNSFFIPHWTFLKNITKKIWFDHIQATELWKIHCQNFDCFLARFSQGVEYPPILPAAPTQTPMVSGYRCGNIRIGAILYDQTNLFIYECFQSLPRYAVLKFKSQFMIEHPFSLPHVIGQLVHANSIHNSDGSHSFLTLASSRHIRLSVAERFQAHTHLRGLAQDSLLI